MVFKGSAINLEGRGGAMDYTGGQGIALSSPPIV